MNNLSKTRLALIRSCLGIAGLLLLTETLLGALYVLGIGFGSVSDILTDLCLTMAFPIFLIGFASLRIAAVILWAFFLAQWVNSGLYNPHSGIHISNPLDWFHGIALFIGATLVSFSVWNLSRSLAEQGTHSLRTVFSDSYQQRS